MPSKKLTKQKRLSNATFVGGPCEAQPTDSQLAGRYGSSSDDDETFVSLDSSCDHLDQTGSNQERSPTGSMGELPKQGSLINSTNNLIISKVAKVSLGRLAGSKSRAKVATSNKVSYADDNRSKHRSSGRLLSIFKRRNDNLIERLSLLSSNRKKPNPTGSSSSSGAFDKTIQARLTKLLKNHRKQTDTSLSQETQQDEQAAQKEQDQDKLVSVTVHREQDSEEARRGPAGSQQLSSSVDSSTGRLSPATLSSGEKGKRRRDKSQTISSSIEDDVLSTIEEKLDDDPGQSQQKDGQPFGAAKPRVRLLSEGAASSAAAHRHRPFTRSKEIDLSADDDSGSPNIGASPGGSGRSQMDSSKSDSLAERLESLSQETSTVSASSASSSTIHTDDTIRPSTAIAAAPSGVATTATSLRRSDSDLVQMQLKRGPSKTKQSSTDDCKPATDLPKRPHGQSPLGRSESSRQPTGEDLRRAATGSGTPVPSQDAQGHQLVASKAPLSGNFLSQSVGLVKAQQQLLQNLVRHQNQNLVANTMLRAAKSALAYPGRIHQSEYPFSTIKRYPDGWVQCTGGVVSVHSVKLLDQITSDEESETRDCWWLELRREIRAHAKALNCNTVLGYSESSRVLDDICILSARGTAAVVRPPDDEPYHFSAAPNEQNLAPQTRFPFLQAAAHSRERANSTSQHLYAAAQLAQQHQHALKVPRLSTSPPLHASMPSSGAGGKSSAAADQSAGKQPRLSQDCEDPLNRSPSSANSIQSNPIDCSFCHTPLKCVDTLSALADCAVCCDNKVPDVLLLSIEPPRNMNVVSVGSLIQARVCRSKRDVHGEAGAKEIGDAMPFLEFELHRQLLSKLRFKGLNCIFNLTIEFTIGENLITGVATGTSCFVLGLPAPDPPIISAGKGLRASRLTEIQRLISISSERNREKLGLKLLDAQLEEYHKQLGYLKTTDTSPASQQADDTGGPSKSPDCCVSSMAGDSQREEPTGFVSDSVEGPNLAGHAVELANEMQQNRAPSSRNNLDELDPQRKLRSRHHHRLHHHHHHHHHHKHKHHHHKRAAQQGLAENLTNLFGDENNIVLEVDDNEDADIISLLIDSDVPNGYLVYNSDSIPSVSQHHMTMVNMFTQVTRVKVHGNDHFAQQFDQILQTMYVKLRRALPCCMSNLTFSVQLPDPYIIQVTVTGCIIGLKESELKSLGISLPQRASSAANSKEPRGSSSLSPTSSPQATSNSSSAGASSSTSSSSTTSNSISSSSSSSSSSSPSSSSSRSSKGRQKVSPGKPKYDGEGQQQSGNGADKNATNLKESASSDAPVQSSTTDEAIAEKRCQPKQENVIPDKEAAKKHFFAKQLSSFLGGARLTGSMSTSGLGGKKGDKKTEEATLEVDDRKVGPKKAQEVKPIERGARLAKASHPEDSSSVPPSTQATIAAVKKEIREARLASTSRPVVDLASNKQADRAPQQRRILRTVFKKQQTFPGANPPIIGGQDNVLQAVQNGVSAGTTSGEVLSGNSARRATANLMKKVKQPLKELGTNFNINNNATSSGGVTTSLVASSSQQGQSKTNLDRASASEINQSPKPNLPRTASAREHRKLLIRSLSGAARIQKLSQTSSASQQQQQHKQTLTTSLEISSLSYPAPSSSAQTKRQTKPESDTNVESSMLAKLIHHRTNIDITSLSFIPNAKEYQYLGALSFSFIRETNSVRENGGLNGFVHCFLMEVYAIVRAHVAALGGNAFTSFKLQQSSIFYHSNKNQAQCLISVTGDACLVSS